MTQLEIIVLAVVQGVAEFLPISSSGHLVVVSALLEQLGFERPEELLEVNIVLHLGTLLSVLVFYWRRVWRLLGDDRWVLCLLVAGTIPIVLVALVLDAFGTQVSQDPLTAGLLFPVTGLLLLWGARHDPAGIDYHQLRIPAALRIGMMQAAAILPGISRSGATIVAGQAAGLRRDSAATFAFLLAIPAILGAGVHEALGMLGTSGPTTPIPLLALGFAVSFAVGYVSLWVLIRLISRGQLHLFAWYLIPLGVVVTIWQLLSRG